MPHERDRNSPFALSEADITGVRNAFAAAGFHEAGIAETFGVKSIPAIKDVSAEDALRRTSRDTPLNALARLFIMGLPVPPGPAGTALHGMDPNRLIQGGLLRYRNGKLYAAVKITPIDGMLIAFDRTWEEDAAEAPDHVMGPSDSARLLAGLVIRGEFGSILDVGAGCGFLTFLAARGCKRVVATDLNPRAAAFVGLNARLNGIGNIEARTGDLFAPVKGERFDLIISNPPFVISPEDRLVYLNGGMKADEFCRKIAGEAPAYLNEGGHFQMLCNWVENADREWQDRLQDWFRGTGCDAWVLRSSTTDPVSYAMNWMKLGHTGSGADDAARLEAWLEYYREEKVSAIGGGAVVMRKRSGGGNWFRSFDGPPRLSGRCGEEVLDRMRALDRMARDLKGEDALMAARFRISPHARLTQECAPSETGWALHKATVQIMQGFAYVEEVDAYFGELLISCDGKRTLREAVDRTAKAMGLDPADVPAETGEVVRQLVDEGFLIPVP